VSELVVDLTDPASIDLARKVLDALGNDWPSQTVSNATASLPVGEAGGVVSVSADHGAQIDSADEDPDPWAVSAQNQENLPADSSEPSMAAQDSAAGVPADSDDDDPWS
jgi:hypothetical protein